MNTSKKRYVIVCSAIIMCLMFCSGRAFAWGPDRPTYTNSSPADFATFNSIIDNVAVGDERNFVRVREAGTNDTYTDEIEIEPGREYEVYIYFHNNAASNTNETGFGVATDTRIASAYPATVNPGERGMVSGFIYWSYVMPDYGDDPLQGSVWDEAYVTTKTPNTTLRYKTGTATIYSSGEANGSTLSTDLFTEKGTYIGFNKLNGIIPGCAEYSGYITYTLIADAEPTSIISPAVIIIPAAIILGLAVCGFYWWRRKRSHHINSLRFLKQPKLRDTMR